MDANECVLTIVYHCIGGATSEALVLFIIFLAQLVTIFRHHCRYRLTIVTPSARTNKERRRGSTLP